MSRPDTVAVKRGKNANSGPRKKICFLHSTRVSKDRSKFSVFGNTNAEVMIVVVDNAQPGWLSEYAILFRWMSSVQSPPSLSSAMFLNADNL